MSIVEMPARFASYEEFEKAKLLCRDCPIGPVYNRVVPSLGQKINPKVVLIGEAPGENEVKQGEPFCGRSGKLLRQVLNELGFRRENTLITNTIPCRPKDNHFPDDDSIVHKCVGRWLKEEISLVKPEVIGIIGGVALRYVLRLKGITKQRGQWFSFDANNIEVPCMPTFHPSYVIRVENEGNVECYQQFYDDLKAIAVRAGIYAG